MNLMMSTIAPKIAMAECRISMGDSDLCDQWRHHIIERGQK